MDTRIKYPLKGRKDKPKGIPTKLYTHHLMELCIMNNKTQIKSMNSNVQYIIMLIIVFLSINSLAQNKRLKRFAASSNIENVFFNALQNDIIIISIINPENHQEIAKLDELASRYQSNGVRFIAITDELNDSIVNSLKYELIHYQYLSSEENERVFNNYQTGNFKVFPMQIITNPRGEIDYLKKGATKNIEQKLAKRIDKLLMQTPVKINQQEFEYTMK